MKRSITFPVDPRWVKNPNNSPLATQGARLGAAAQTKLCIATIGLILGEHWGKKPGRSFFDVVPNEQGGLCANKWIVRLTRISMGTLDPITGGATMKAVQDAVARWCGVPNERDPVWHWIEPIGQEKRRSGYFGVRIELEDLEPGASRPPLTLENIDRFVKAAKEEIKRAKKGKKPGGLARRAEHLIGRIDHSIGVARQALKEARQPLGPGGSEDACPRTSKPCPRAGCWAALDLPCKLLPGDLVVCGVHAERAQAAGVEGIALPHPRPSEAKGPRRDVPSGPRPVPVFVVLPWKQKRCAECFVGGFFGVDARPGCKVCERTCPEHLTAEPRVDGRSAPRCLRYRVPVEHVARWGSEVVLWPAREPVDGVDAVVFREGKRG